MNTMNTNKKPLFSQRLNRVEVAVWRIQNETSFWHNITFQKGYRDSEGNLQSTTSLLMEDLPALSSSQPRPTTFWPRSSSESHEYRHLDSEVLYI